MIEHLFNGSISLLSIFLTAVVGAWVKRLQAREDEKKKQREADSKYQPIQWLLTC